MKQLPEYGENDVLKLNLAHGILLYAIYESCEQKPGVNELRKFYHDVILSSKIVKNLFANTDMTCAKRITNETKRATRSEKATHPYTWQYKISDIGDKRFTAKFSRCGIYDYFTSKRLEQLVPAMCLMDYSFCEVQNHIFLRKETLATGGRMCDCTYINKDVATEEELQNYEDDMKNETREKQKMSVKFRNAERKDTGLILQFIRELAEYEKMSDDVVADEATLEEWIFDKEKAEVIFAMEGDKEVGFALYFHNFSTFLGRAGIYLEDLFVKPEYRGKGYGKATLKKLASIAVERGCGRLEWCCLDWNKPSLDFYLSLGAVPLSEWKVLRVTGQTLTDLAKGMCSEA